MSLIKSDINNKHKIIDGNVNVGGNNHNSGNILDNHRDSDNVQLNELFVSIEGEGIFAGTKTLFVRFSGCHLRCYWCDTKYSLSPVSGNSYSIGQARNLITEYLQPNIYKVNFTGGEPLLQPVPLMILANFVKNELNIKTYLESSCYDWKRFESVLPYIDICKIELKTSDSKVIESKSYDDLLQNELKCLELSLNKTDKITFIKIVFTNSTKTFEIRDLANKIFQSPNVDNLSGITLQPSYQFDSPTNDHILKIYDEVCNFYKDVRVIPQMHKLLGMS
jgi:organic radical activating enzyme